MFYGQVRLQKYLRIFDVAIKIAEVLDLRFAVECCFNDVLKDLNFLFICSILKSLHLRKLGHECLEPF